jgi:phosphoglycerate dehydrogenase-like enzyme
MKVLIPDSIALHLPSQLGIEFIQYSISATDFSHVQDAELLVMWMNSPENTRAAVEQLPHLKLVQTLAAGPDHALGAGFAPHIQIASGRGLHDKTVAEHTLALALASVRSLVSLVSSQKRHYWDQEIIQAQASPESAHLFTLNGAKVLILGFGSIANHLAPMLTSLGAHVSGVAQSAGTRNGYPVVSYDEIAPSLKEADLVISLLPYDPSTEKRFNLAFFQGMKASAIFINVGRGRTVDEAALIQALEEKLIRRAAIDVTYSEPLASDSPLWDLPELLITPHISGGRPQEAENLILHNAQALATKSEIKNIVAR